MGLGSLASLLPLGSRIVSCLSSLSRCTCQKKVFEMNLPLNQKSITIVAVSLAVIVAAIAAIVVSANRADEAKAYAEAEAAQADAEASQAKAERAQADAEIAKRQAAEANAKAKADERAAAEANAKAMADERAAAADKKAAAEANADAEEVKAVAARAIREAAKLTNETARVERERAKDLAAAEQAKADAEAAKLAQEKLKAEKIIAEAKALELRKIDYETLERDLLEWKLDLEERERALKPEKTIADLEWAGGMEDTIIDDKGNVTKQVKKVYDPEKDMELPEQSRRLAKMERKIREAQDGKVSDVRETVVKTMEKLYISALKAGRVIDADFYKKNILIMYPDWKFQGEQKVEK